MLRCCLLLLFIIDAVIVSCSAVDDDDDVVLLGVCLSVWLSSVSFCLCDCLGLSGNGRQCDSRPHHRTVVLSSSCVNCIAFLTPGPPLVVAASSILSSFSFHRPTPQ